MTDLLTAPSPTRVGAFKLLRASHLGMCFGVRDAIRLALQRAATEPLTVLGDLVHNESVLANLRQRGIRIEQQVAAVTTPTVMVTAHGASHQAISRAQERRLRVIEATCPLVRFAHGAVARLVREGFHPVIIGKRDHVEVRGITEDLAEYDVVLTPEDVARMTERPRFGVAAQTTQPIDKVHHLVALICERFPHAQVRFIDTVCQPTKQRQSAAIDLARQCEVIVVVGGAHSNNTQELAATCGRFGARVYRVQTAAELRREWFAGAAVVGITAGTSTPDEVIETVERRLEDFARGAAPAPEPVFDLQTV